MNIKGIGETESYKVGYKHGVNAGIFNTLNFLVENGYVDDSEFFDLKNKIEEEQTN